MGLDRHGDRHAYRSIRAWARRTWGYIDGLELDKGKLDWAQSANS